MLCALHIATCIPLACHAYDAKSRLRSLTRSAKEFRFQRSCGIGPRQFMEANHGYQESSSKGTHRNHSAELQNSADQGRGHLAADAAQVLGKDAKADRSEADRQGHDAPE